MNCGRPTALRTGLSVAMIWHELASPPIAERRMRDGTMRADVLMECSLKYSLPWQRSAGNISSNAEASVNMRAIY